MSKCEDYKINCDDCPIKDICHTHEQYDVGNILLEVYDSGVKKGIHELYNEILYIESKFRSMLLNVSQESNLIEWVDLNGKLTAITTIKHFISDKLKEQKNE